MHGSDPLVVGVVAMIVMLGLTALAQHAVNRLFPPDDPRRAIASKFVLWGATALLLVILLLIRRE